MFNTTVFNAVAQDRFILSRKLTYESAHNGHETANHKCTECGVRVFPWTVHINCSHCCIILYSS